MQVQDTPTPLKTKYRGADWEKLHGERVRGANWGMAPTTATPRLGSSAHFVTYHDAVQAYDGPSYLATLKRYGENGCKLVYRTVHERPRLTHQNDRPHRNNTGKARQLVDPFTLKKSAHRAKSKIEDWIRMTCTKDTDYRLCTATKRGGMTLEEANNATGLMRRQVEKHYDGVKILSVPELHHGAGQNAETYHVHMILVFPRATRPNYSIFQRLWYKALGGTGREKGHEAPGNFDFAKTHAPGGKRYTACQAARYVSKYVTKDITAGNVGKKRYTKTHGAPDAPRAYWWQPIALDRAYTRAKAVEALRQWFPAESFVILSRTFNDGGDTYHVFSAEPVPK